MTMTNDYAEPEDPAMPSPNADWQPIIPCRPELLEVIRFIRDALEMEGLTHLTDQSDEEADVFTVACADNTGTINTSLVGWSTDNGDGSILEGGRIFFAAHDQAREGRDIAAGVHRDDSRCWWDAKNAETLLMHLRGDVARIVAERKAA